MATGWPRGGADGLQRQAVHGVGKGGDLLRLNLQPRSHGVPAEADEVLAAPLQRAAQVETRNGSAGALAQPVWPKRDQNGRAVEAVHQTRRDDADDPGMPARRRKHDGPAAGSVEPAGSDHLHGLIGDRLFGPLALLVLQA